MELIKIMNDRKRSFSTIGNMEDEYHFTERQLRYFIKALIIDFQHSEMEANEYVTKLLNTPQGGGNVI